MRQQRTAKKAAAWGRVAGAAVAAGCLWLAPVAARAADEGAATSNDVAKVGADLEKSKRELIDRVKALEAKTSKLEDTLGTQRGAESFDSISQRLRDLERKQEQMDRDLRRMQDSVRRLESRR